MSAYRRASRRQARTILPRAERISTPTTTPQHCNREFIWKNSMISNLVEQFADLLGGADRHRDAASGNVEQGGEIDLQYRINSIYRINVTVYFPTSTKKALKTGLRVCRSLYRIRVMFSIRKSINSRLGSKMATSQIRTLQIVDNQFLNNKFGKFTSFQIDLHNLTYKLLLTVFH